MSDTIHVDLIWDFGDQSEDDLTKDQLWDLVTKGHAAGDSRVTSLIIWTTDALACVTCDHSTEQHGDVGYCLNPGCDCQACAQPSLAAQLAR